MADAHVHLRTDFQSRRTTLTVSRAVAIPYVHEVMASITKKTIGLTPYLLSVFQTTNVAPKV